MTLPTDLDDKWTRASDVDIDPLDFLLDVFGDVPPGEVVTATIMGRKDDDSLYAQTYAPHPNATRLRPGTTHFCPSTFRKDAVENGAVVRSKRNLVGAYAIVQDDVGEKASALNLPPSWVLETKPGSFQFGFLLSEPLYDMAALGDLLYTMGQEGFTDEGSTKTTQLFRLPGSRPPGKKYVACLRNWAPNTTYTYDDIRAALGGQIRRRANTGAEAGVTLPPGSLLSDDFTNWVRTQPWYIGDVGATGFESILCPWHAEHTNGDLTAGFHPPTEDDGRRAFHCFHGHCSHRTSSDFVAWCVEQGAPPTTVVVEVERPLSRLASAIAGKAPPPPAAALAALIGTPTQSRGAAATGREPPRAHQTSTDAKEPLSRRLVGIREHLGDVLAHMPDFVTTSKGAVVYVPTATNVRAALDAAGVHRTFNVVRQREEWRSDDPDLQRLMSMVGPRNVSNAIADEMHFATGAAAIRGEVANLPISGYRSPAAEYLDGLPAWDGKDDPISELVDCIPAADAELCDMAMRRWLVQAVQAAYNYREPDDEYKSLELVPIFTGGQGTGKTTFIRTLAPRTLTKTGIRLNLRNGMRPDQERDLIRKATSCWIGEIGEIESTSRESDVEAVKNCMSQSLDEYRLPYGTDVVRVPRSTVWFGTANSSAVLHDRSGNRRYIVIALTGKVPFKPRPDGLMGRVWAQARRMWEGGAPYHLTLDEVDHIEKTANAAAAIDDIVGEALADYFGATDLQNPGDDWQPMTPSRIVDALIDHGAQNGCYHDVRRMQTKTRLHAVRVWLEAAGATRGRWSHPTRRNPDGRPIRVDQSYRMPTPPSQRLSTAGGKIIELATRKRQRDDI